MAGVSHSMGKQLGEIAALRRCAVQMQRAAWRRIRIGRQHSGADLPDAVGPCNRGGNRPQAFRETIARRRVVSAGALRWMAASFAPRKPRPGDKSEIASSRLVLPVPFAPAKTTGHGIDAQLGPRIGAEIGQADAQSGERARGRRRKRIARTRIGVVYKPCRIGQFKVLNPHRHEDVKRARVLGVFDERG